MRKGAELLLDALESQRKTPQGSIDSTETVKTLARLEFRRGNIVRSEQLLRQNLSYLPHSSVERAALRD